MSDGKVLFLFFLLNLDEHYPKNVGVFEQVLSTVQLNEAARKAKQESRLAADVPGTTADRQLQEDIASTLFDEASKVHKRCQHVVLRAQPYARTDPSVIAKRMGAKGVELESRLREKGQMVLEKWLVRSCEREDAYEVVLVRSAGGGTDILVQNLSSSP